MECGEYCFRMPDITRSVMSTYFAQFATMFTNRSGTAISLRIVLPSNKSLDFRIGFGGCQQVVFGHASRHHDLRFNLTHDLNGDLDRRVNRQRFVKRWPCFVRQRFFVPQRLPDLFRNVRSETAKATAQTIP